MRLKIFCSLLFFGVTLSADSSLLSKRQNDILQNEQKQNIKSSDILKLNWINPITATLSRSKSDKLNPSVTSDSFTISLNQPIFKSGGIYYAIKYAKANREFLELNTKLKKRSLIKNVLFLIASLKDLDLKIEKERLLIENADIDIKRKREQFLSGVLDSSFLDNAMLNKNSLQMALLDMEASKFDLLKSLKDLSDIDYKSFSFTHMKLLNIDDFLSENLNIKDALANSKQTKYIKKMTISNYFPTISLFANYNYSKSDNGIFNSKDSYKQYGLRISMPLFDINRGKNIELQRLKYLKSKLMLNDTKQKERDLFNSVIKKVEIYNKKIKLSKEQAKLYSSLLKTTKNLYDAGEKTIYDVKTLKNSLKRSRIDEKIYRYEIDKILLDLYEHIEEKK